MAETSLSFAQMRANLDTRLNDAGNVIWPAATKDLFMTAAMTDPYAYQISKDDTTTTVFGTPSYPVPAQFDDVMDVLLNTNSDGYFYPVDPGAYTVINGTIMIDPFYSGMVGGITMRIIGRYQMDPTQSVPIWMQEYLMQLALMQSFEYLTNELGGSFLTNDMTMAQLIQKISYHMQQASLERGRLRNKWLQRM